jgi:hypothetical protein
MSPVITTSAQPELAQNSAVEAASATLPMAEAPAFGKAWIEAALSGVQIGSAAKFTEPALKKYLLESAQTILVQGKWQDQEIAVSRQGRQALEKLYDMLKEEGSLDAFLRAFREQRQSQPAQPELPWDEQIFFRFAVGILGLHTTVEAS